MPTPTRKEFEEQLSKTTIPLVNKTTLSYLGFALIAIFGLVGLHSFIDTNNAGFYKIRQAAGTGKMTAITTPGVFLKNFADVTTYKASDIIYFSKHEEEGRAKDESITVQFNDGATANVTGNVRIDLPVNADQLIDIHKHFRSYDSLIKDTVKQVVGESVILTASLMTAEQSYTTKRAEFSQLAYDQLLHGVYLTEAKTINVKDSKTGESVDKEVVVISRDEKGIPRRKESVLGKYGITIGQFVVKEIDYEKTVADQIQTKQQSLMKVVSAKAEAEKAVQDRLTAEEVGRKNVAVAKYEQEVKKATAVTQAEQELDVAKLHRAAEEQNKAANIAKGEGEGEYRRKLMIADGALDKKLAAYVETQKAWASAVATSANRLVPEVVMGGNTGSAGGQNAAMTFMDILGAKAARDLSLNLGASSKASGKAKSQKDDE